MNEPRSKPWVRVGRGALSTAVFALIFVLNPALIAGCGLLGGSFEYGEPEMVALLDSVNRTERWKFSHEGADYELVLEVERRGKDSTRKPAADDPSVVRPAHSCENRSFVRSAAGCLDTTEMPIVATVTLRGLEAGAPLIDRVPLDGELEVIGLRLERATLRAHDESRAIDLSSKDGKTFDIRELIVKKDGKVALRFSP